MFENNLTKIKIKNFRDFDKIILEKLFYIMSRFDFNKANRKIKSVR